MAAVADRGDDGWELVLRRAEPMFELWLLAGTPLPVRAIVFGDEVPLPEWTLIGFLRMPAEADPLDGVVDVALSFNCTAALPMEDDWPNAM